MYVPAPYACLVPVKARRGCWNPGTGATDNCEVPCEGWESSVVLLTAEAPHGPNKYIYLLMHFIYVDVLSACMRSKRGHWISWDYSCRVMCHHMGVGN